MFELFSDIYFIIYKLYYVDQNDNLDIHVSLKNWERGSILIGKLGIINRIISNKWIWQLKLINFKISNLATWTR
jgi:hypothetical protein